MPRPSAIRFYVPLFVILLAFLAIEIAFLPMPGIQEDEALFALPFLHGHPPLYSRTVGNVQIPLMLMDYIGALKTWIYWPIFKIWPPNVWSIRLPACFFGMLTIWILAELLRRAACPGIALFTALLLATDTPFVLTNVFDWGPVSLLLLSTVLLLNLFRRFLEWGKPVWLGAACLLAGAAVWYKTLYLVVVAAMALSCLLVFWGPLRKRMEASNILVALLFFLVGAAPLIAFNLQRGGSTLTAAHSLPAAAASEKLMMLQHTLDGRALEHYMFRSFPGETIALTGAPIAELMVHWYQQSSFHPASFLFPAVLLALIALPFLRNSPSSRPLIFTLLFTWLAFGAAETAMLSFRDAGAGVHHTVLLYPAPQFIVAATAWIFTHRIFTERRRQRMAVWAIALVMAAANLWLLRGYYEAGKQAGFSVFWTDGVQNLAGVIASTHLPVAFLDWGIQNGIQVQMHDRIEIVNPQPIRSGVLYVAHCAGYIIDESQSKPYEPSLRREQIVTDRHGAPLFCLSTKE